MSFELPPEQTGPAAWYGPEMSKRTEWLMPLSAAEIAEVEQVDQGARRARGRHRRDHRRGFCAADARAQAPAARRERGAERPRLPAAARPAGRALDDARSGDGVLRPGRPSRQRALAERQGPRAGPREGSRARLERSQRAHLPDARAADLSHRFLRHRRAALPQDREVRRPVGSGELDHDLQRDAPPAARSAEALVRARRHRPARRGAGRTEALLRDPAVQLAPGPSHARSTSASTSIRRSASPTRRGSRRRMSRRSTCSTR